MKAKQLSRQVKVKVVEKSKSRLGSKKISKTLEIPWSTIEHHVYPNQKPCMTREVQLLLKERNIASGLVMRSSTAWHGTTKRGIRQAKRDYNRGRDELLDSNNSRQVLQGVQHIANFRTNHGAADVLLAEVLKHFFARFEVEPPEAAVPHAGAHNNITSILMVEECQLRHVLSISGRERDLTVFLDVY